MNTGNDSKKDGSSLSLRREVVKQLRVRTSIRTGADACDPNVTSNGICQNNTRFNSRPSTHDKSTP